jgi:hypothetical protein
VLPRASVFLPVPTVDRSKTDFPNVMATVMNVNEEFYQLATEEGFTSTVRTKSIPTYPLIFLDPRAGSSGKKYYTSFECNSIFFIRWSRIFPLYMHAEMHNKSL